VEIFGGGRDATRGRPALACPLSAGSRGLRLGLSHGLELEIERHCSADEILQGRLIDLFAFADVDRAPHIAVEAGVEQPRRSSNAAPLANVILTTFLYASPVQRMPPWEKTGVPIHFHSSTISGSALCMIAHLRERLPAPIPKFVDPRVDECRGRFSRDRLFHEQLQLSHLI
jgi:hypothetical protein